MSCKSLGSVGRGLKVSAYGDYFRSCFFDIEHLAGYQQLRVVYQPVNIVPSMSFDSHFGHNHLRNTYRRHNVQATASLLSCLSGQLMPTRAIAP